MQHHWEVGFSMTPLLCFLHQGLQDQQADTGMFPLAVFTGLDDHQHMGCHGGIDLKQVIFDVGKDGDIIRFYAQRSQLADKGVAPFIVQEGFHRFSVLSDLSTLRMENIMLALLAVIAGLTPRASADCGPSWLHSSSATGVHSSHVRRLYPYS